MHMCDYVYKLSKNIIAPIFVPQLKHLFPCHFIQTPCAIKGPSPGHTAHFSDQRFLPQASRDRRRSKGTPKTDPTKTSGNQSKSRQKLRIGFTWQKAKSIIYTEQIALLCHIAHLLCNVISCRCGAHEQQKTRGSRVHFEGHHSKKRSTSAMPEWIASKLSGSQVHI
eukprot:GHVL01017270.1.p1 GENE.GHVL01017270.1~~GHVL01017270.1.p1  ORF type:complete len:167 (-),score=7.38 GHVL01017270.1:191-691(-)